MMFDQAIAALILDTINRMRAAGAPDAQVLEYIAYTNALVRNEQIRIIGAVESDMARWVN